MKKIHKVNIIIFVNLDLVEFHYQQKVNGMIVMVNQLAGSYFEQ